MTNTSSTKSRRALSFSETSELYIVPAPAVEFSTTWYSSQERQGFRRSMVECIREVSREIGNLPTGAAMKQEQLVRCLGIELFISNGATRQAAEDRRAHIDSVLAEQSRQKENGTCDIERLSFTSQKGSRVSKERARKLAMGYAALSME